MTWLYVNDEIASQDIEVSYMTNGVTWNADYVLVVNKDDTLGDIAGWVTLDNQSGAIYKDAQLKLVAGKPNVVQEARGMKNLMMARAESFDAAGGQFEEESFFEYHLYDLQRKTTIKDKQTKQISLIEAVGISLKKAFVVSQEDSAWYWQQNASMAKVPVKVTVTFTNSEANRLGMPLPAGIVRLYKQDKKGGQQFIGEDRIDHTPKDEDLKLNVGEAFDIVAEQTQTAYNRVSNRTSESAWQVSLRNHKDEDIVVMVEKKVPGMTEWEILTSSMPFKKKDAQTFAFEVPVPRNGEAVLSYSIQVTH